MGSVATSAVQDARPPVTKRTHGGSVRPLDDAGGAAMLPRRISAAANTDSIGSMAARAGDATSGRIAPAAQPQGRLETLDEPVTDTIVCSGRPRACASGSRPAPACEPGDSLPRAARLGTGVGGWMARLIADA
jgi:hypothetical protein